LLGGFMSDLLIFFFFFGPLLEVLWDGFGMVDNGADWCVGGAA